MIDHFVHFGNVEFTDNAAVRQHITPVNTRVQGFIKEIRFEEFQPVHKGDTLLIIEDSEFRLRLAQAAADLANALAGKQATSQGMNTTENDMLVTDASIEEARVKLESARREEARYAQLLRDDAATQQQYDNVNTAYLAAKARYEQLSRLKQTLGARSSPQPKRRSHRTGAGGRGPRAAQSFLHRQGIWAGCLFSLGWLRLMRWNAYKLIAVGLAVFSLYAAGFYFLADSSLNSEALRLPLVFRGFSYAVLSIALMWCLHEIMSFQHFFQALSIFNILHMFVGGLAGAALHARGLNYYVADGFARYSGYLDEVRGLQMPVDFARYMEQMVENLLAQSVKILFGWTLYAALFFALLMLLWDIPGVRRRVKHMQTWPRVGLQVLNGVRRQQKLLRLRRKRSKME